jgi:protein SCO1/2
MVAIAVTAVMAPHWSRPRRGDSPPPLGRVPVFSLTNRDGATVTLRSLAGAPWVANFIFTRCALSCPRMTEQMRGLGSLLPETQRVRRVSFTVDPEYDTPKVLQLYAETWQIEDDDWLFLTGDRDAIRELVTGGFKLGFESEPPAEVANPLEPILHSTRFVLVDANGAIRGYYDAFRPGEVQRLVDDLAAVADTGPKAGPAESR